MADALAGLTSGGLGGLLGGTNADGTKAWAIGDWKCPAAVSDKCKGVSMDWNSEFSFRQFTDELITILDFLLSATMQFMSSQLPDNIQRGINALRCAIDNLGTNTWSLLAGTYQLLIVFGLQKDIDPLMNEMYGYVCTCQADIAGLKSLMGINLKSSAVFSMCSEKGSNAKVAGEKKKADATQAKVDANTAEVKLLAQQKVERDTARSLLNEDACVGQASSEAKADKCFERLDHLKHEAFRVKRYWREVVHSSGGTKSTTNRVEQSKLERATWTLHGISEGLHAVQPERWDKLGNPETKCEDALENHTWGDTLCVPIIAAYKAVMSKNQATAQSKLKALFDVKCYKDNAILQTDGATPNTIYTGKTKCALKPLANDLWQWVDNDTVKCTSLLGVAQSGIANCSYDVHKNIWVARKSVVGRDQEDFRTLGKNVGVNVDNEDVKCIADNLIDIRYGAKPQAYCYAKSVGSVKEARPDGGYDTIDEYLWLSTESIKCKNATGATVSGLGNCKKAKVQPTCTATQIASLKLHAGQVCIPDYVWELK